MKQSNAISEQYIKPRNEVKNCAVLGMFDILCFLSVDNIR